MSLMPTPITPRITKTAGLIADVLRTKPFINSVILNNGFSDDIHITSQVSSFEIDVVVCSNFKNIIIHAFVSNYLNNNDASTYDGDLYSVILSDLKSVYIINHANAIADEIKKFALINIIET